IKGRSFSPAWGPQFDNATNSGNWGRSLVYHVGKFMSEQPSAVRVRRTILRASEENMLAQGVGPRTNEACRLLGVPSGVDSHTTEVVSEARLEICESGRVQRLTVRAYYVIGDLICFAFVGI